MIPKINNGISIVKSPIRSNLKVGLNKLKNLNGSSMSGGFPPRIYEVDMIIPGGLTLKEKAYYLLKGKFPSTVYERWIPKTEDVLPKEGDQVVTMDRTYDAFIGNSGRNLHDITSDDITQSINHSIEPIKFDNDDTISSLTGVEVHTDAGTSGTDDGTISLSTIWEHLAGLSH